MVDKNLTPQYTSDEANFDNNIRDQIVPIMKGDTNMGRQKVHVELPNGEKVWITGSSFNELVQNAIKKYGNQAVPYSTETFKEYTEKIFDVFLRPRWKDSTANTNKFLLDKHILPYFSSKDISEIGTVDIQQFFQLKQHLSKSYTKQMLILLHEIFENAVEDGKVAADPTVSKRITLPQKKTIRKALEPSQFQDIINHLDQLDFEDAKFMAFLCFTGMRRGEILGLKWDNVLNDKILVRSEVIFKGNKSCYCEFTKSKSGIRDLPMPVELTPYLKMRGEGFIFGKDKPYTQSKFDRMWQRIGKKINLYGATPHAFRHTYLTMLASINVDPKTIQCMAGHSDFSFTFNKYIDKNKANIQNAGEQFSEHIKSLRSQ